MGIRVDLPSSAINPLETSGNHSSTPQKIYSGQRSPQAARGTCGINFIHDQVSATPSHCMSLGMIRMLLDVA